MGKSILSILLALVVLLLCAGAAYGLRLHFRDAFTLSNTVTPMYDATTLDLSGEALEDPELLSQYTKLEHLDLRGTGITETQYLHIQELLPSCEILWDIPFQGTFYAPEAKSLTIAALSDEDLHLLAYFPALETIFAQDCPDLPELHQLMEQYPDLQVQYAVPLGGKKWAPGTESMALEDVSAADLYESLPYLPQLKEVQLSGELQAPEVLSEVILAFPQVAFSWEIGDFHFALDPTTTRIELSGVTLPFDMAQTLISCFPKLEYAGMLNCGLTDTEMKQLATSKPDCFFLWEMVFLDTTVRTDAEKVDISKRPIRDLAQVEELLTYMPMLTNVDMCDCGISNEDMDALNQRYPDIRFVWAVQAGPIRLRTDATVFAPVTRGLEVDSSQLDVLRYCTDLVCVDLGHQKIYNCDWAAYTPHLKYLVLADTPLRSIEPLRDHTELVFLELFLTSIRDVSPLTTCTALEDLNLCYDYLDPSPIGEMTWLKRLWWSGNYTARVKLPDKLPDTETNFLSASSTGEGWREGQRYFEMRDMMGMYYMKG